MRTIRTKVYKFSELSKDAQQKAISGTLPVHANSISAACSVVCKFLGEGYFYKLFTI